MTLRPSKLRTTYLARPTEPSKRAPGPIPTVRVRLADARLCLVRFSSLDGLTEGTERGRVGLFVAQAIGRLHLDVHLALVLCQRRIREQICSP